MPRENFPDIQETEIFVSSSYPGNTAEDIETLITNPLEEAFKGIQNVKEISSSSIENFSMITIEFNDEIDVNVAKQKVQEEINSVVSNSDWPVFNNSKLNQRLSNSSSEEMPIINISLIGDYPSEKMKFFAENLKDDIEELDEIIGVEIVGIEEFEVEISLDIFKMNASKVSFDNVVNSLNRENQTISAGNIIGEGQRRNIRLVGEISDPSELKKIVVKSQNGAVYLNDIASIEFKEKEKKSYARSFGKDAVMLNIKKRSNKNLILAVKKLEISLNLKRRLFYQVILKLKYLTINQAKQLI